MHVRLNHVAFYKQYTKFTEVSYLPASRYTSIILVVDGTSFYTITTLDFDPP